MNHNNQQPGSADLDFDLHELQALCDAVKRPWYGTLQIADGVTDEAACAFIEAFSPDTASELVATAHRAAGGDDLIAMQRAALDSWNESRNAAVGALYRGDIAAALSALSAQAAPSLPDVAMPEQIRDYLTGPDLYAFLTNAQNGIDSPATMQSANRLLVRLDKLRELLAARPAEGSAKLMMQARSPEGDPWHDAVLAECMKIETAYKADDPAGTVRALINWYYEEASGVSEGVKRLADNYMRLTCATPAAEGATQADELTDAARYAWLRDQGAIFYTDDGKRHQVCESAMDATIDAARGDKQGAQGGDNEHV